jgi:hypothetical protein
LNAFVRNLFALTLIAPILSPTIGGGSDGAGGLTVYLYIFIPIFDGEFIRHLLTKKFPLDATITAGVLVFLVSLLDFKSSVSLVCIFFILQYCFFLVRRDQLYIVRYINIAIGLALLQLFVAVFYPAYKLVLGPTEISHFFWGSFATRTNANIYLTSFNILPRVSGLSREAGFFAALLSATFLFYISHAKRISRWQVALFFVGLFISFSKITVSLLPVLLLWRVRKQIDKVPLPVVAIALFLVSAFVAVKLDDIGILQQQTFTNRFNGYLIPFEIDVFDLIFGMNFDYFQQHYYFLPLTEAYRALDQMGTSFAFPILYFGLPVSLMLLFFLQYLGVKSFPLLCFFLVTFDVTPVTLDSMVILAWLYVFTSSAAPKAAQRYQLQVRHHEFSPSAG